MSTKKGATAAAQSKATKNSKGKESAKVTNEDDESDKEDEKDKYPWKEGDNLAQLLKEKYKETEKLKVLLETMESIPGMDPDKYNQFVFNGIDDAFDFRDTKIVTLAKKVRNLSMKLNKINALNEASKKDLHELRGQYDELKSNHDSILQKEKKQEDTNKPETEKRLQKELVAANKTIEELKRRQHQLNDEVKNLQRALRSELGDGTPLDQAYDATWKGRAELVTMLKVRLKKYETGMIGMSTIDNNRNNSTIGGGRGGISSHTSSRVFDVIAGNPLLCYVHLPS